MFPSNCRLQRYTHIDAEATARALKDAGAERATHVFHCAFLDTGDPVKDCEVCLRAGVGVAPSPGRGFARPAGMRAACAL